MSDQDKINAIIQAIQTDSTLLALMKLMIANNIVNVPSLQLTNICNYLGINTSGI